MHPSLCRWPPQFRRYCVQAPPNIEIAIAIVAFAFGHACPYSTVKRVDIPEVQFNLLYMNIWSSAMTLSSPPSTLNLNLARKYDTGAKEGATLRVAAPNIENVCSGHKLACTGWIHDGDSQSDFGDVRVIVALTLYTLDFKGIRSCT